MNEMPLDPQALALLREIVERSLSDVGFPSDVDVNAMRPGEPWLIDELTDRRLVRHGYRIVMPTLAGLEACDTDNARAEWEAAGELFQVLLDAWRELPAARRDAHDLAQRAGWAGGESKVGRLLQILSELMIFPESVQAARPAGHIASVSISDKISHIDPFVRAPTLDAESALELDITLEIRHFRAIRAVHWTPAGVCLLAGPNGSGKSSLLAGLAFLQDFYNRDTPSAVQDAGGADQLRNLHAPAGEPIVLALALGPLRWEVQLASQGWDIHPYAGETLSIGETIVLKRAPMSSAWYFRGERRPGDKKCCLRLVHETDLASQASIQPLIDLIQTYAYHPSYDLHTIRAQSRGSRNEHRLDPDGINLVQVLRTWHSASRTYGNRFAWIMKRLSDMFPEVVEYMEFHAIGKAVDARFYLRGMSETESSLPLYLASDGLLTGLLHLASVAGAEPGSIVAIDEMEDHLHPYAIRSLLRSMREMAEERDLTIILATHSPVLMNEFKDIPESFFVTEEREGKFPVSLDQIHDPDWLAHFSLGDLYDRLEFGAPLVHTRG